MKKNILFIVSSAKEIGPKKRPTGNFLTETAHPYVTFRRQGYDVDIYSIQGGEAPLDGMADKNNELNQIFLNGEGLAQLKVTKPITEIGNLDEYDAVFVPGGLAPMVDMPENEIVHDIIKTMWESGKVVSAVCHGPVSLLNVRLSNGSWLIKGKNITAFSNDEEENYAKADVPFELETALRGHGCNFSFGEPWQPYSITDGRLVTGQNPASALGVGVRVVTILESNA
jgi:putative intracellular protease/amidase